MTTIGGKNRRYRERRQVCQARINARIAGRTTGVPSSRSGSLTAHSSKDLLQQLAGVFGIESGAEFYDPEAIFGFKASQSGFPETSDAVLVSPNHPKAALLLMIGEGDTAANL